jgi:hypothetical protein
MLFVGDLPRGLYPTDRNNFGPRFGFAYDVTGNGRFAIRGAWGLFYDTVNADSVALENPPFAGSARFFNGRLSNPLAGQTPPPVVPDAENFEFVYPINLFFHDLGIRTPYIQMWNLTLEHQIAKDWAVQAAYVGKDSKKLQAYRPFNVAQWRPGATLENIAERAPFLPGIYGTEIIVLSSAFNQHYESAQFRVDKRFSRGFTFQGAYTYGKAIDHNSEYSLGACVSNPYDLDSDRGRADFDSRHTFAASWLWTPVSATGGGGWFRKILGGWNFSGTHRIRSGYPMTFYIGDDVALGGDICGGGEQHPDLLRNPERSHSSRDDMIASFFDTGAFAVPQEGTYGSAGRNILTGPGSSITDLAILKDFGITEQAKIQVRAEFANAFNQVNFGLPRRTMTDSRFGEISSAGPGRQIQLGLKVIW